jgi:hypothetical protein
VTPDELPEELDATVARPYQVPDIARRRLGALTVLAVAAGSVAGFAVSANSGLLVAGLGLSAIAAYQWACAWPRRIDQTAALAAAAGAVGFPVGHASAQLAWRGLRSRPTWRVLLYSADDPPSKRGLVELDAVDGVVLGHYTEDNPEDWTV